MELQKSSRERWIWRSSCVTLGQVPDELSKHLESLLLMLEEPDPCLRKSGLEGILKVDPPLLVEHHALLAESLADPEWIVRECAVKVMGHLPAAQARQYAPLLLQIERMDPEFYVQQAARDVVDACQFRPPARFKFRRSAGESSKHSSPRVSSTWSYAGKGFKTAREMRKVPAVSLPRPPRSARHSTSRRPLTIRERRVEDGDGKIGSEFPLPRY